MQRVRCSLIAALACVAGAVWPYASFAQSTGQVAAGSTTAVVGDSSCLSVATAITAAIGNQTSTIGACSSDPVVVGTTLAVFSNGTATGTNMTVTEISAPAPTQSATTTQGESIDYTELSEVWSFAFGSVIALYLIAKNAGAVLSLLRG